MKFVANSKELSATLSTVAKIVSSKNTLPILDNIYMIVKDGQLEMRATDLETTIISYLPIEMGEDGIAAIPAKVLTGALKEFRDGPITLEFNPEIFNVKITAGDGEYEIAGDNPADYPNTIVAVDEFITLDKNTIIDVVDKVSFATLEDEHRPLLNGVLFENKGDSLNIVASDTHVMAIMTIDGYGKDWEVVVNKRVLSYLRGLLGKTVETIDMGFNDKNVVFVCGKTKLISRLIDGKYPAYSSVIPKNNNIEVSASKEDMLSAIKRISMFGNPNYPVVSFSFTNNAVTLRCQDIDRAMKGTEKVACGFTDSDITIGFSGRYMTEILNTMSSLEYTMTMQSPERAVLIYPTGENVKYLLMPVLTV